METKFCNQCNKDKSLDEFSKLSRSKDGKQPQCKSCNKINNAKFRESRPDYQNQYYGTDKGRANKIKALERYWDTLGAGIYVIVNKESGSVYVGETNRLQRRKIEWYTWINNRDYHYMNFEFAQEIEKYGTDCWKWEVVEVLENPQKKTLLRKENEYINIYSKITKVLNKLNVGDQEYNS